MARNTARQPVNLPIGPLLEWYGADLTRARSTGWSKVRCFMEK